MHTFLRTNSLTKSRPVELCLDIYISSSSHNLLQFLQCITPVLYTVKEKGGKPNRKPYPLPCGLRNPYIDFKIMPRNSTKMFVHEFGI
jgi:hypothetical protein